MKSQLFKTTGILILISVLVGCVTQGPVAPAPSDVSANWLHYMADDKSFSFVMPAQPKQIKYMHSANKSGNKTEQHMMMLETSKQFYGVSYQGQGVDIPKEYYNLFFDMVSKGVSQMLGPIISQKEISRGSNMGRKYVFKLKEPSVKGQRMVVYVYIADNRFYQVMLSDGNPQEQVFISNFRICSIEPCRQRGVKYQRISSLPLKGR